MAFLGDLVDIKGGGTPSRKVSEYWGGNIPWATVKDFKSFRLDATQEAITELGVKKSATNVIPAGAIIVPTRMAVGKAAVTSVDMAINQDLKALLIKDTCEVDQNYLLRFLLAKSSVLEGMGKGATVKGITLDVLRDLEIPLPPLKEQKRIAAILDKADSLRRKRQQAIELADDFLRAVFLDMFAFEKGIKKIPLDEIVIIKGGGTPSREVEEYWGREIPWATVKDFKSNKLDGTEECITELGVKESATNVIPAGNIIIPTRMSVGKVAVNKVDLAINQDLKALLIKDKSKFKVEFLMRYLITQEKYLLSQAKGATVKGITLDVLRGLDVPTASVNDQIKFLEISKKVNNILSAVQEKNCKKNIDSLFPSLCQKAFAGEL